MKRHAKASTAGSTKRRVGGIGPARVLLVLAAALLGLLALGATSALADNAPSLSEEKASQVGVTTVKLSAKVNPNGAPGEPSNTEWRIEYRHEGAEEWSFANGGSIGEPDSEASNPIEVEALIGFGGELKAGEKYQFRAVAENQAGKAKTPVPLGFQMQAPNPPSLSAEATEVGLAKATLKGKVDPEGGNVNAINEEVLPIHWQLQYSEDPDTQGWTTAAETFSTGPSIEGEPAKGSDPIEVEAHLTPASLKGGTTYKFRLRALYASPYFGPNPFEADSSVGEFTTDPVAAPIVSAPQASSITTSSAHFSGSVEVADPDEAFNASCRFEYLTQKEFEADGNAFPEPEGAPRVDCTPNPVTGSEAQPVSVSADASGLQTHTIYHLRLVARNAGGQSATQAAGTFATEGLPPTLGPEVSTAGGEGEVTIRGFVNPHNTPVTDCHFEYGTSASYGQEAPCEGDPNGPGTVEIPPKNSGIFPPPARVSAKLTGLTPGATLHYRLVADNGVGPAVDGPDETVDVPAAPEEECPNVGQLGTNFLPDCRAYEMVSPPNKNGGDVLFDTGRIRAAEDGDAIQFSSISAFGDAVGTGVAVDYMAIRDGSPGTNGWATHAITPPQRPGSFNGVLAQDPAYLGDLSPDLSRGIFRTATPLTNDPSVAEVLNLYLRNNLRTPGEGSYQLTTSCPLCDAMSTPLPPINPDTTTRVVVYVGASDDFHHVVFQSLDQLTSDSPAPSTPGVYAPRVYEWDQGQLRLVGYVPSGSDTSCGGSNPPCVAADASVPGQGTGGATGAAGGSNRPVNVISADGRRVFFSANNNVYMRTDHTTTDQLNASERSACITDPPSCAGEAQSATYWGASVDGSRVFFTTGQQLTDEPAGESNLYMYDTTKPASDEHNLTLINVDHELADESHEVKGVIAVSDDGSYVYFSASGQLVAGAPELRFKIGYYMWHEGHISYIGRVVVNDTDDAQTTGGSYILRPPQSRLSADGRSLLLSTHSGAGFATENDQGECDTTYTLLGCRELYLYRADTDQLVCVSCNPSGAPAKENATSGGRLEGGTYTTWHLNRNVSDNGRYAFFSTPERLLEEDTNGKMDAYEYDTRTGQLHLLSSGTDPFDSYFMESSADASDAFILTRERLSGWDTDSSLDVYDARIDGGLPEPPVGTSPCSGESCRQSAPQPPATSPAASADFSGPGNPKAPHGCPKGRHAVRAKGKTRCVKPHKKHHKRETNANRRAGR